MLVHTILSGVTAHLQLRQNIIIYGVVRARLLLGISGAFHYQSHIRSFSDGQKMEGHNTD